MTRSMKQAFARPRDGLIILGVVLLAVLGVLWTRRPTPDAEIRGRVAEVYVADALVQTLALDSIDEVTQIPVPGRESVVLVLDPKGTIQFQQSDCRDQLCVHYGPLRHINESFACLPNEVVVVIVDRSDTHDPADSQNDDPDIIVG